MLLTIQRRHIMAISNLLSKTTRIIEPSVGGQNGHQQPINTQNYYQSPRSTGRDLYNHAASPFQGNSVGTPHVDSNPGAYFTSNHTGLEGTINTDYDIKNPIDWDLPEHSYPASPLVNAARDIGPIFPHPFFAYRHPRHGIPPRGPEGIITTSDLPLTLVYYYYESWLDAERDPQSKHFAIYFWMVPGALSAVGFLSRMSPMLDGGGEARQVATASSRTPGATRDVDLNHTDTTPLSCALS
ncbi:hypothetical protein QBC39DRAFT_24815 [Podospora conica]|nr:hypothetical protein QBC39DRAFT_24815 [Schizothecium conicum]